MKKRQKEVEKQDEEEQSAVKKRHKELEEHGFLLVELLSPLL